MATTPRQVGFDGRGSGPRVLAVDLGATSLRVVGVDLAVDPPDLRVIHRSEHGVVRHDDGSLRWDWDRLITEIEVGLTKGVAAGPVDSIGVDTWGVDYGLIDEGGGLVAAPFSYRSERTLDWERLADRFGRERLYQTAGIQMMGINTLFQLAVHDCDELAQAKHLLMLPELVVYALTGVLAAERTSAGTSGLVDVATGQWSPELVDAIGVDIALFEPIQRAGAKVGEWRGVPVHLVGGHDTASALASAPLDRSGSAAFVSSGTWMLVGRERERSLLTEAAQTANFSNEPAVGSGVRLLKNVMGLWMFEQCRAQWAVGRADLLAAASGVARGGPTVDATDERFLAPPDMAAEVKSAAGLRPDADCGVVARCVLDSLAVAVASIVAELESLTDEGIDRVVVVGGGVRNTLLNELIAEATGVEVVVGPAEASALGNALVQGVALGHFADLNEARAGVRGSER